MEDRTGELMSPEGRGRLRMSLEALDSGVPEPSESMEDRVCNRLYLQELFARLTPSERESAITLLTSAFPFDRAVAVQILGSGVPTNQNEGEDAVE